MEIEEHRVAIIPCAGNGKRMGDIDVPKSLYKIEGKPALVDILKKLDSYFSSFYIPISNKTGFESLFRDAIPYKYLKKINFVQSLSGSGDGQAVLDALKIINKGSISGHVFVCWGDIYIRDTSVIKSLVIEVEGKFAEDLIIPTRKVKNPYVRYFPDNKNNLIKVALSRRGQFHDKGLTDLSVFFIKPAPVQEYLTILKEIHTIKKF